MSTQSIPDEGIDQAIEDVSYDIVEKSIAMSGLPKALEYVLRVEMEDFMSESPRVTAEEIADRAGVNISSVFRAHKDARYIAVKDKIQDIYFQGKADRFYHALLRAADANKVGAIRLGLEVTGKHVNRVETRNINVNADILSDQAVDIDSAVDRFLIMLGTKGWSLEMIADKWRSLKSQQAF